jgi:hypothetical protein
MKINQSSYPSMYGSNNSDGGIPEHKSVSDDWKAPASSSDETDATTCEIKTNHKLEK